MNSTLSPTCDQLQ